jgi:hypothetical protein
MKRYFGWLWLIVALGVSALLAGDQVLAFQDPADGDPPAAEPAGFHEQSIYIPYNKLREVFEAQGRGVFLPYEQFQELWKAARDQSAAPPEAGPPLATLIAEATNEAEVSRDVVRVRAKVRIELLAPGWHAVPLRLADAAIISAKLKGQPARITFDPNEGHKLLIEKKGKQPEQIELELEYAKAFAKSPGQNSVSFQSPQAPVSRWQVRIPESGVKVDIHPLIAASEAPADDPDKQETVVLAFVGAADAVRIDWNPKAEGATGLAALVSAQAQQEVTIDEGVIRARTLLTYDISRAELPQVVVEVPSDYKVVNVFDANIRQWSVEEIEGAQRITAELFEPAKGTQTVTVELERFSGEEMQAEQQVPAVKALNVGRQQGVVVVTVAPSLRAEAVRRTGLLQTDAAELPGALSGGNWTFAYRYAALPYDLALSIEKVQPRIVVDSLVEAWLEPEQLAIDLFAGYTIERAGVFQLLFDVPAGFEVRTVTGHPGAGYEPVTVDSFQLTGDDKTRLVVNLARKALGRVGLTIALHRRLEEADLLTPTGKSAAVAIPVPRVVPDGVERASGRVIVYAPESLRVNPSQSTGLRSISFAEALEGMQSARPVAPGGGRPVLAFAFAQEAATLDLAAERRKPQVTARQLLSARIESGVARFQATLYYDIRYSGVKSLRIDIPADLAGELRNDTPGVQEKTIDPPPVDLPEGYVAWSLTGETEFTGQPELRFSWERQIDNLELGKSVDLPMPRLRPAEVDRAWGQIVLAKSETIDVHEAGKPTGLRPIDPRHDLMQGASVADAARAFEFHDDWKLDVTATLYQLEEIKRTSIERAVLRMVATRGDQLAVQALYRMRSAQQRLAVQLPSGVQFDTDPVRINGQPVALERGDKDDYFVPLVDLGPDQAFLLELRYTAAGGPGRLEYPQFPSDPAVQKVYVCAYLPEELALVGSRGPWTDELTWVWRDAGMARPYPRRTDTDLVAWVTEGLPINGNPLTAFPTDGTLYTFSTVQPPALPDGALRLSAINGKALAALVFGTVLVAGVLLLGVGWSGRVAALGALVVALVLAGVFFPMFSLQVINSLLATAIGLVLVIWIAWHFAYTRPRDPREVAARAALAERASAASPVTSSTPASETGAGGSPFAGARTVVDDSTTAGDKTIDSGGPPPASPPRDQGRNDGGTSNAS